MKRRLLSTARFAFPLAAAFAALLAAPAAFAQAWSGAASGAWLTAANWTGGVPAGSDSSTTDADIAVFNGAPDATFGIDMNATSGPYDLGAIDYTNATARNFEHSSTTDPGVLTLNGATVDSVANTILRHSTTTLTTIRNGAGLGTMGLALGNATNNIIRINHSGVITISSNITGSSRNLTLSSISHGSGVLTLSGTNSYTGNTPD